MPHALHRTHRACSQKLTVQPFSGHTGWVLALDCDANTIVSAGSVQPINIWDARSGSRRSIPCGRYMLPPLGSCLVWSGLVYTHSPPSTHRFRRVGAASCGFYNLMTTLLLSAGTHYFRSGPRHTTPPHLSTTTMIALRTQPTHSTAGLLFFFFFFRDLRMNEKPVKELPQPDTLWTLQLSGSRLLTGGDHSDMHLYPPPKHHHLRVTTPAAVLPQPLTSLCGHTCAHRARWDINTGTCRVINDPAADPTPYASQAFHHHLTMPSRLAVVWLSFTTSFRRPCAGACSRCSSRRRAS